MKTKAIFLSILLLNTILIHGQQPTSTSVHQGNPKKCNLFQKKAKNDTNHEMSGPYSVDPKSLEKKSDTLQSHYHNEQDEFRRPDSIPYHPAPNLSDSLYPHNYSIYPEDIQNASKPESNPAVAFGFDAESCSYNTPPDNALAISNGGYIMSAVNCGMYIYNSSGQLQGSFDYSSFFNTASSNFSDPRVIYDINSDKFIFLIQYGNTSAESKVFVAFSTSNNPTQSWNYYSFNIGSISANHWFDYPSIGLNQNDFCYTGNLYNDDGTFATNILILIHKQDGYNGSGGSDFHWIGWTDIEDGNGNLAFTIAPASLGQDVSYNNIFYLVSTLSGGGNYVVKYKITGSATNSNSTITSTNISTSQYYYPSATATEPSGIDLANYKAGCRVQAAMFLNNFISFVFAGNYNNGNYDYNSIYYCRINVSSNSFSQNWSYLGGSNYNYPSIASYGQNSSDLAALICFFKSDNSTNPEIRFKYFDTDMNQLASTQVRAGESYVNYSFANEQRWGDYSAIQRKFNAGSPEAWLGGSFGNSSHKWQTYIAHVTGYPGNVAISEVTLATEPYQVFPNPVSSQLYLKGDFRNYYGFPELFSIDGNLLQIDVTRKDNEMFQVDVSRLPPGIYVIKFNNDLAVKFIKG